MSSAKSSSAPCSTASSTCRASRASCWDATGRRRATRTSKISRSCSRIMSCVRKQDNDYKVVDIDVEGVSMLVTQREEFGSVIQRSGGTIAGLNKTLQERLASGDTSLAAPPLPQKQ